MSKFKKGEIVYSKTGNRLGSYGTGYDNTVDYIKLTVEGIGRVNIGRSINKNVIFLYFFKEKPNGIYEEDLLSVVEYRNLQIEKLL